MANDFVRNIKGVRNINKLSRNITTENDLISTIDNNVYVVTNDGYKKITWGEIEQDIDLLETDVETLKTSTGNNTSEIETLKTTINNYKVLLFDGTASSTGDIINLNTSYKDFTELRIKVYRTGGNEIFNFDSENDDGFSINYTNLFNDNSGGKLYEMNIDKLSPTELKINSQRSIELNGKTSDNGGITVLKIWGVK